MSIEEKKAIEGAKPVTHGDLTRWWDRIKKMALLWEIGKAVVIVGAVLVGQAMILESKVAEVLSTPKRTTALEKKDSAQFAKFDSSTTKHSGYFMTLFEHVDTTAKVHSSHSPVVFRYTGQQ